LIWFGNSVAFGACCFFAGLVAGDSVGVSPGATVSVGVAEGVSDGSGGGEPFFFRCDELFGDEDGLGETFFFLSDGDSSVGDRFFCFFGVAEGDSSSAATLFFFFGGGDGVGDSVPRGREDFFEGVAVGVGDFFLAAVETFFFLGVGVGDEKIFFNESPRDCSAGLAASIGRRTTAIMTRMRRSM
jgi:hypothetical protein